MTTFLIVPGYGDSGPEHWQSQWQRQDARFRRVEQRDWFNPVCAEWVANLEDAVEAAGPDCVLVAHSLVAPPDPLGPAVSQPARGQ